MPQGKRRKRGIHLLSFKTGKNKLLQRNKSASSAAAESPKRLAFHSLTSTKSQKARRKTNQSWILAKSIASKTSPSSLTQKKPQKEIENYRQSLSSKVLKPALSRSPKLHTEFSLQPKKFPRVNRKSLCQSSSYRPSGRVESILLTEKDKKM